MQGDVRLIHDAMSETIVQTAAALALNEGAGAVTVRKIIRTLGVTNRVFYNRFHNAEEVLWSVLIPGAIFSAKSPTSRSEL